MCVRERAGCLIFSDYVEQTIIILITTNKFPHGFLIGSMIGSWTSHHHHMCVFLSRTLSLTHIHTHTYTDLVRYLETTFTCMAFMPDMVREAVHFTSCNHIAKAILVRLFVCGVCERGLCVCMYVCVCMCVCMHACVCVCMCVCVCVCFCVCP